MAIIPPKAAAALPGNCNVSFRSQDPNSQELVAMTNGTSFEFHGFENNVVKVSFYLDPAYSPDEFQIRRHVPNSADEVLYSEPKGIDPSTGLMRYEADVKFISGKLRPETYLNNVGSANIVVFLRIKRQGQDWMEPCSPRLSLTLYADGICYFDSVAVTPDQLSYTMSYESMLIGKDYEIVFDDDGGAFDNISYPNLARSNGVLQKTFQHNSFPRDNVLIKFKGKGQSSELCSVMFTIPESGEFNGEGDGNADQTFDLCSQIPDTSPQSKSARTACYNCTGIWSAVGCIPTNGSDTIATIVTIALGMAGGFGLLMIIAAGGMLVLSRNDTKKVGDAKDMISSVVMGLLFIVFSVTILQFIGVSILKIPGFGG